MVACAVVCLCALADGLSMACPWFTWGRNGSGGSPKQREPDESNALCFGGTLWSLNTPSTPSSKTFPYPCRADPSKSIPPFEGRHPFHHLVFWVGHLFQPFFIVWCVDCLFCRFTGPNQSSVMAQGNPDIVVSLPQGS